MIEKRNIITFLLCILLFAGSSRSAVSEIKVRPEDIDITFEYDDNVTRERSQPDYQYGVISRLTTGFRIEDFVPVKGFTSAAKYQLRMRDVNTTNDEDYSSQEISLSSRVNLRTGTAISLKDEFRLWNSQRDLFNFYDNTAKAEVSQSLDYRTTLSLSYTNVQKRLQNDAPEVQARNFYHNQFGALLVHKLADAFWAQVGYDYGITVYNRRPIDFKGDRQIVLDGVQRDRRNVVTLGFQGIFLDNKVFLDLRDHVIRSNSNSRVFDFNGNKAEFMLNVGPFRKLSVDFIYRIVAYDLEAYRTPESGYELSEPRSDDQSGITLGVEYDISDQVLLRFGYERIENTVFFTKEFYEKNVFCLGLRIKL